MVLDRGEIVRGKYPLLDRDNRVQSSRDISPCGCDQYLGKYPNKRVHWIVMDFNTERKNDVSIGMVVVVAADVVLLIVKKTYREDVKTRIPLVKGLCNIIPP